LICGAIVVHGEYQGVERPQIDSLVPKELGEEAMSNYVHRNRDADEQIGLSFSDSSVGDEEPF